MEDDHYAVMKGNNTTQNKLIDSMISTGKNSRCFLIDEAAMRCFFGHGAQEILSLQEKYNGVIISSDPQKKLGLYITCDNEETLDECEREMWDIIEGMIVKDVPTQTMKALVPKMASFSKKLHEELGGTFGLYNGKVCVRANNKENAQLAMERVLEFFKPDLEVEVEKGGLSSIMSIPQILEKCKELNITYHLEDQHKVMFYGDKDKCEIVEHIIKNHVERIVELDVG
eukprot:UN24867